MYAYEKFKQEVKETLEKASGKPVDENLISVPPDPKLGDLSSSIAFKLGGNPKEEAEKLVKKIKPSDLIADVKTAGPYVNFCLNWGKFNKLVLEESIKEKYGSSGIGKGEKIVIDYSSPNIAKPFTVGHLRSTIIGQSLYGIFSFLGFKCIGINHLGDWGTQFGKLIMAYKKWGDKETIEKDPIKELLKLYVKFHEEAKTKPEFEDSAREWFKKLEEGDNEAKELWNWFYEASIKKFKETYKLLGVKFDKYEGESTYAQSKKTNEVVTELLEKGIAKEDQDGSIIVPLEEYGLTNSIIQKSDGATLYITRDIAAAEERWEEYNFYREIYVVGGEQKLHFQQLFKILELLGYEWYKNCSHVWFGMITLPGVGKMKTREGKAIFLEDVLNKAISMAEEIVNEKNPDLTEKEKEKIAKAVGIGAMKFADLSQNKIKDISFDWGKILSFEGDTAPYLQYAHARCCRILEKLGKIGKPDYSALQKLEERGLIKKIAEFPEIVKQAGLNYEIHALAQYLLDLVHIYSSFYDNCPVIKAETPELKAARAEVVKSTKNVLKRGLNLLGIEAPERM